MEGKRMKGEMSEINVPIEIEAEKIQWEDDYLAMEIVERISYVLSSLPNSIYRVPDKFRIVGEDSYQPRIISIGPYHHGKHNLQGSEKYKATYVRSLVSGPANFILMNIINIIREMENEIRKCYAEDIHFASDEFIRMMIFDGCFILELLKKYQEEEADKEKDLIFSTPWIVPSLRRDLVLLENQIPFFVLERLYEIFNGPPQTPSLIQLVLDFFDPILPTVTRRTHSIKTEHILDLLRGHMLPHTWQEVFRDSPTSQNKTTMTYFNLSQIMSFGDNPTWENTTSATDLQAARVKFQMGHTTCATDLQEAGVRFKGKAHGGSLLDVTFANGEFEIPPFYFGELWTVLIPNMIVLEQCRSDYGDEITSYAILMDNLINSHKDVKLLCDKGIILGSSKEDKDVADIVNNLSKAAIVNNFHYDELCHRVKAYRQGTIATWRADFMRKFIHTPWAGISVIAGTFLLLLTVVQTVFTIMSWKRSL